MNNKQISFNPAACPIVLKKKYFWMIILFTLLAGRGLYRFINATLWAEDGTLSCPRLFSLDINP
jgi:hypothetical protein